MANRNKAKRRDRDWSRSRPDAAGPSVEGGTYRGLLRGLGTGDEWWRCTSGMHGPHRTRDEARKCAQEAAARLAQQDDEEE